jgi:hypothetical protein
VALKLSGQRGWQNEELGKSDSSRGKNEVLGGRTKVTLLKEQNELCLAEAQVGGRGQFFKLLEDLFHCLDNNNGR